MNREEKKEMIREANIVVGQVMAQREEIMQAFAAKYNCDPNDMVQVEKQLDGQTKIWFIVKKSDCIFCSKCEALIAKGEPVKMEKENGEI